MMKETEWQETYECAEQAIRDWLASVATVAEWQSLRAIEFSLDNMPVEHVEYRAWAPTLKECYQDVIAPIWWAIQKLKTPHWTYRIGPDCDFCERPQITDKVRLATPLYGIYLRGSVTDAPLKVPSDG